MPKEKKEKPRLSVHGKGGNHKGHLSADTLGGALALNLFGINIRSSPHSRLLTAGAAPGS